MKTFHSVTTLIVATMLTSVTAVSAVAAAGEFQRPLPKRAHHSWEEVVAKRQAQFAADPASFAVPVIREAAVPQVIAANEADPVEGLVVEWWCNPEGPDAADVLWMKAIETAVNAGAEAHVYLYSWVPMPDEELLETCSGMLQTGYGISPDQVQWYQEFETDSFWLRDFGPFFVRDVASDALSVEDAKYYPGRPHDDAQPRDFAERIDVPVSDFDLYYEGGNFLPNGGGLCLASSVLLDANPHLKRESVEAMFRAELGCEELVIVDALKDAATGHVDMWMAWADHTTLLVGEYTVQQDAVNSKIIERNVRKKLSGLHDPETGAPIKIVRVPMPSNCPLHYFPGAKPGLPLPGEAAQWCPYLPPQYRIWRSYLNVLQLNGRVLLPVYAEDRTHEAEAIRIWEEQGFEVIPLEADIIAPAAGEFHCVTKTIDAPR